jgi:hypothetical protein
MANLSQQMLVDTFQTLCPEGGDQGRVILISVSPHYAFSISVVLLLTP